VVIYTASIHDNTEPTFSSKRQWVHRRTPQISQKRPPHKKRAPSLRQWLNKTVLKQFQNWFVSVLFQWADTFMCDSHKFSLVFQLRDWTNFQLPYTKTYSELVQHVCKLLAPTNSYRWHRLNDYCRHGSVVKTPACPMHSATHRQYKVRDAGCCVISSLVVTRGPVNVTAAADNEGQSDASVSYSRHLLLSSIGPLLQTKYVLYIGFEIELEWCLT